MSNMFCSYVRGDSVNTTSFLVAKPTVDILDQAGVEVTVGQYLHSITLTCNEES